MKIPMYNWEGKLFPNSDFKKDTYYKSKNLSDVNRANKEVYINAIRKENNSNLSRLKNGHVFIKQIFLNFWDEFKLLNIKRLSRKSIIDNVERFLDCENISKGFNAYKCDLGCGEYIQAFTCKSRFCPKCGKKYRDKRNLKISEKLIETPHRQFVFSTPEEYRNFFQRYRYLLNALFSSVNESFNMLLGNHKGISKREHRRFGFISFLHTYGRDMKWNPHIHVLIAERYITIASNVKVYKHFHYNQFRKIYQYTLMNNVYKMLKDKGANKKDITSVYFLNKDLNSRYKKGFYVHGPKLKNHSIASVKNIANYIARYASHPAISERRILNVDYKNKTVTWFYDPHEDDDIQDESLKKGRQIITEHVYKFMERLIVHIPDKHFRQIRYYGFYANNSKLVTSNNLFTPKQLKAMEINTKWETSLLNSFGYTPLMCNICGGHMKFSYEDSYFPSRQGGD